MSNHTLMLTAEAFLTYLRDVKQRPDNTVRAYGSDLRGAAAVLPLPLKACYVPPCHLQREAQRSHQKTLCDVPRAQSGSSADNN